MITSPRNPKVAAAARLRKRSGRDDEGSFLVEGAQGVREALAGPGLEALFHTEAASSDPLVAAAMSRGIAVEAVSDAVMARLSDTVTPQGLVGVARALDVELEDLPARPSCVAVLCSVRDPGNAGTILRSADAAGADAVVFAGDTVDAYNPKAVRSSAGSVFHVPIVREVDPARAVDSLRARGMRILAMAGDGEHTLWEVDLTGPVALLFGNEAWGLPREVAALADASVRIPISGPAESLNLASAASVCLFEVARRRGASSGVGMDLDAVIAGAAHDIRSPLTAVRSFIALLQANPAMSEADRRELLAGMAHDAEQTDLILRQLIDAARLAAGQVEPAGGVVALSEVMDAAVDFATAEGSAPEIAWRGSDLGVRMDASRLRVAIGAMLEAAQWWAREGDITIEAEDDAGLTLVEVSRHGATVGPDEVEDLFVPRRPGTGAGSKIGLLVARGLAEAHGGNLTGRVQGGRLVLSLHLPR